MDDKYKIVYIYVKHTYIFHVGHIFAKMLGEQMCVFEIICIVVKNIYISYKYIMLVPILAKSLGSKMCVF